MTYILFRIGLLMFIRSEGGNVILLNFMMNGCHQTLLLEYSLLSQTSCFGGVYYTNFQNMFDERNRNRELSVYVIVMHTPVKGSNISDSYNNEITVHSTYRMGVFISF